MAPCPVPAGTTQLQNPCVASASFFRDGVAYSHTDSVLGVWPRGFPDSQEADVQVRVPGMVLPVLSDDPASLVPEGHGGWEVCVWEASRHFSPILFECLSWEINFVSCV